MNTELLTYTCHLGGGGNRFKKFSAFIDPRCSSLYSQKPGIVLCSELF